MGRARLEREQARLSGRVSLEDGFHEARLIAGADSSYSSGTAFAAVAVLELPSLGLVEASTHAGKAGLPYVPGLLFHREGPALTEAFRGLRARPDILLADGHGIAHPRGLGLASQLGLSLGIPTVGVAKSLLTGEVRGERVLILGRQVGWALRAHGSRPLYASPGHMVSLHSSREIVLSCMRKGAPEPLRMAHLYSRQEKDKHEGNRPQGGP